jgi:hypothetical protein
MSRPKNSEATIVDVLDRARKSSFSCKSDFARRNAFIIAACASEGYLTSREATGLYVRQWMITGKGIIHLDRMKEANRG